MLLSIIIPLYNNENLISNCLDSLLTQDISKNEYEIIVVNDGSTDNSAFKVQNYIDNNTNIYLINQPNSGVGAARNKGIEFAKGAYIYFLDSDDYIAQNCLGFLLQTAIKNKLDILGFQSETTKEVKQFNWNENKNTHNDIEVFNGVNYVAKNGFKDAIWWYIIRREFLQKTQLKFNEQFWAEDALFNSKILYQAERLSVLNTLIHKYVQVSSSIMHAKDDFKYNKLTYSFLNLVKELSLIINYFETSKIDAGLILYYKKKRDNLSFFLLGRSFKSNLNLSDLKKIIVTLKKSQAYPIKYFEEKNKLKYRLILSIFNTKQFLFFSFITAKFLKKIRSN